MPITHLELLVLTHQVPNTKHSISAYFKLLLRVNVIISFHSVVKPLGELVEHVTCKHIILMLVLYHS